jgi:biotin operon repressor
MLPQDPVMLLSFLNMKLRDNYVSLEALTDDLDISSSDLDAIVEKLKSIGYTYDKARNQFV